DAAVGVAHQIAAGDVAPHALRRIDADALRAIERRGTHDLLGDDTVLDDLLAVVDVVDELVERVDALLQPALDPVPLLRRDDARHEIEGEGALGAGRVAVDV